MPSIKSRHTSSCFLGKCIICLVQGHIARDCPNVVKPNQSKHACGWCFLQFVCVQTVHRGYGTSTNEYGSQKYCPYQNLVSLAVACWNIPKFRKDITSFMEGQWGQRNISENQHFFQFLGEDSAPAENGKIPFSRYAKSRFEREPP